MLTFAWQLLRVVVVKFIFNLFTIWLASTFMWLAGDSLFFGHKNFYFKILKKLLYKGRTRVVNDKSRSNLKGY